MCGYLHCQIELRVNTFSTYERYVEIVSFFIHEQKLFFTKSFFHSNPFLKSLLHAKKKINLRIVYSDGEVEKKNAASKALRVSAQPFIWMIQ